MIMDIQAKKRRSRPVGIEIGAKKAGHRVIKHLTFKIKVTIQLPAGNTVKEEAQSTLTWL
jgi:hypothetical protein